MMKDCRYSSSGAQCGSSSYQKNDCNQNLSMEDLHDSSKSSTYSAIDFMAKLRATPLRYFLFHNRRRIKRCSCKTLVLFLVILPLVYLQLSSGIFQRYFLEKDFGTEFNYAQDFYNFHDVIQRCLDHKKVPQDINPAPKNTNYSNVEFLQSLEGISANESIGLLIIVKSATNNYKKRMSIRRTWGDAQYLKENRLKAEYATKVVFISGIPKEYKNASELFANEKHFGDIVVAHFHDSYENNTYKTVLAMRWAVETVKSFKYLMIVDDDMYVNLTNTVTFLQNISRTQVQAVMSSETGVTSYYPVNQLSEICSMNPNISLAGKPLIMGQLIVDAKPFRSSFGLGSKWSMSMEDYSYNYFPPYIAGGVTIFDSKSVGLLYYGSFFTKHFWVDDVYIGIIAHKLGITLTNNNLMDSSYRRYYRKKLLTNLHEMIAMHGLSCPEQLIDLWHSRDIESLKDCYYLTGTL